MDLVDSLTRETNSRHLPRVELEILRGRAKQKIRRIDVPVFLIGSARDCDLVLADADFPEVHTYVYVNQGGVSVRRLGDGPELAVDGREVQSSPLTDGQTLQIGKYEFAVRIDAPHPQLPKKSGGQVAQTGQHSQTEPPEALGIALVRALLEDIRTTLKVEANLQLYVEQDSPWRAITSGDTLLIRKVSA